MPEIGPELLSAGASFLIATTSLGVALSSRGKNRADAVAAQAEAAAKITAAAAALLEPLTEQIAKVQADNLRLQKELEVNRLELLNARVRIECLTNEVSGLKEQLARLGTKGGGA